MPSQRYPSWRGGNDPITASVQKEDSLFLGKLWKLSHLWLEEIFI